MIGCLTETTTCVVAKHINFSFMLYNTLHDWIIITSWKRLKNIINLMLFLFHCFNLMVSLNVSLCMYSVFLSILSLYSLYTYQSFNSRGEYCSVFPPPQWGEWFCQRGRFSKVQKRERKKEGKRMKKRRKEKREKEERERKEEEDEEKIGKGRKEVKGNGRTKIGKSG